MREPGRGLNCAVHSGVAQLAAAGVHTVTVAHGDLPRAKDIGRLRPFDGVTLIPDRYDDGTNVLRLPATSAFAFSYGPGSFRRHRAEASRLGLAVRVMRIPSLAYDVDWPADVAELHRQRHRGAGHPDTGRSLRIQAHPSTSRSPPPRWPLGPIPTTSSSAAVRRWPSGPRQARTSITWC